MIDTPVHNTYNYLIVYDEWHIGDPIPQNVQKVLIVQYEPNDSNKKVTTFDVPIFIFDSAENVLTETEILLQVEQKYATTATMVNQKCYYEKLK